MENTQHSAQTMARYAGIFAAGVIIGVLVSWAFTTTRDRAIIAGTSASSTEAAVVRADAGLASGAQDSFEVPTEQKAGKKVTITRATVMKPTWIVVYEGAGSDVGRALGASLFTMEKQSGIVTLLRATVPGKAYYVGQALDNGNGTFSTSADTPVMVGGERLLLRFVAQ